MKIIVCGAGTMGSGIAETAARSGYITVLYDPQEAALDKARGAVEKNLSQLAEKQKITTTERDAALDRISFTNDIDACTGDLVIEAIVEDIEIKKTLFHKISAINAPSTILASNTSSLSLASISGSIPGPERFCGMHFFNPAQLMKLVEVVHTDRTSEDTMKQVFQLALSMGKTPVVCKDSPGFIVNRVARHFYLEALQVVSEGVVSFEEADKLLENAGFRMGPFRLMDLIGNDINYAVTRSLYEACGKPERFRPSPIQEEKVKKGEMGRKTGKGYYNY